MGGVQSNTPSKPATTPARRADETDRESPPGRSPDAPLADDLIRLAHQVREALLPVEPRREFVRTLRTTLEVKASAPSPSGRLTDHAWFWAAVVLGGTASLVGVVLLVIRTAHALARAATFLFGLRVKKTRSKAGLAA